VALLWKLLCCNILPDDRIASHFLLLVAIPFASIQMRTGKSERPGPLPEEHGHEDPQPIPNQEYIADRGLRLVRPDDDSSASLPSVEGLEDLLGDLATVVLPDLRKRAERGDPGASSLLERFLAVNDRLGVTRRRLRQTDADNAIAVDSLIRDSLARRRVPRTTYRLQFNRDFTFRDACDLVPYLHALGISDCYASPILQARAGSSHGYDICDHSRLSSDLGSDEDFDAFAAALREHGMGLILDAVPNHMGIGDAGNVWWMDVLENGPGSPFASFFDIDWSPVNPDLKTRSCCRCSKTSTDESSKPARFGWPSPRVPSRCGTTRPCSPWRPAPILHPRTSAALPGR